MYHFLVVDFSTSTSGLSFGNYLLDLSECDSVEALVILSAILLPIKSPVASIVF